MKQFCKECWVKKELSDFYPHPQWKNWVLSRCKECIKAWRKSLREREMARKWEKENRTRPEWYLYNKCKKYRQNNPKKYEAHKLVNNYYRYNKDKRPNYCYRCWRWWQIELHHEDYSRPDLVYPLCSMCHKWVHSWLYKLDYRWEIKIPF